MTVAGDRTRWLAVSLLAVALLVGVLGGIAAERFLLTPDRESAGREAGRRGAPGRGAEGGPARMRRAFNERMSHELGLTPAQRASVDSLLAAQQARSRAIMARVSPELDSIAAETRSGLREILTPAQWDRMNDLRKERRGRARGRP
ncbi:MAG: hypothetical protein ACREOU_13375 [Candidatus Eiseniibacteriota bacterium]